MNEQKWKIGYYIEYEDGQKKWSGNEPLRLTARTIEGAIRRAYENLEPFKRSDKSILRIVIWNAIWDGEAV